MCVTNIYVDRYPDGREVEFRQLSTCQYGLPTRPCSSHSILENPTRKIAFGEPTTQYMMTNTIFPSTPPRSSGGSHHRHSAGSSRRLSSSPATSEDSRRHRHSKSSSKPHRTHRKERIVIVDAPPTPGTPPQRYQQTFSTPSSPNMPFHSPRGRPIIVDERGMRPTRAPSVGAILGDRTRPIPIPARRPSLSRPVWDSPSSSHTSFDLRAERAREERRREELAADNARRARQLAEQAAAQDAAARRAQRIREQDEEIRRRPAVPIAPRPLNQRAYIRPIVDNSQALSSMMGGLSLGPTAPERARRVSTRLETVEAEAQRQRLRERQMPKRRFTVGPGHRRSRVVYENGVYRYE